MKYSSTMTIEEKREWRRQYTIEYRKKNKQKSYVNPDYYKKWYAEKGRKRSENYQDIINEWIKNNPEKAFAQLLVQRQIKKGLLIKPEKCSICGRKVRLSGHHQDYFKPLEVVWLCGSCHKKIHAAV